MVRYHTPSIRERGGVAAHLAELGLDGALFVQKVDAGVRLATLRDFFCRPDGTKYHRDTIKKWRDERLAEKERKQEGEQ